MSLNFGMNNETIDNEIGIQSPTINRLQEVKDYTHRVVVGVLKREFMLYPSWGENSETGQPEQKLIPIDLDPNETTVLDKLRMIEKRIRKDLKEEKPSSMFNRTTRYVFMVFDRENPEVELVPYEYPWQVFKDLRDLQEMRAKDDSKLKNGPIYTWDAIIQKLKDPNKRDPRYAISYKATVDTETIKFAGQIPVEAITDKNYDDTPWLKKALTEEEFSAVMKWSKEHPNGLLDYVDRKTDEQVLEQLHKFPVNLGFMDYYKETPSFSVNVDGDNQPFIERMLKEAAQELPKELLLVGDSGSKNDTPQLESGVPDSWEDAEDAEVDDTDEGKDLSNSENTGW